MIRKPVSSSNLKSIGYYEETKILEVEFKDGSVYQYSDVPKEICEALMNASSHGRYFHRFIKDRFLTTKIK